MEIDRLQLIRNCFESNSVFYTRHAKFEMKNEEFGRIFDRELYESICSGEVIEEYPDDLQSRGKVGNK